MSRTTLRVALLDGERYTPLYERLPEFTGQTGIGVEVGTQLALPDLVAHLESTAEPYDVVCAHSQYTAGLAPGLLPLDELLSPGELEGFSSPALELCRWEGRPYQLPRGIEPRLLYYRSDIFDDRREREWFAEASGGSELRVPRSWEELAAVAQYFTRAGRMYGFAFPGESSGVVSTFAEILTTVGGTFFDAELRPRFYSRAGEWALTLLRDLHTRWEAVPPEALEADEDEISRLFRMGRCAMIGDVPGRARLLGDPTFSAVAGWHSVALLPAGPNGRRAAWTGCPTFAVPVTCSQPEAAAELLRFLTSAESQREEARAGTIPSREETYTEVRESLRLGTLAHLRFTLAEETLGSACLTAPAVPRYAEIERRLGAALRPAIRGELEPAAALQRAHAAVEAILGEEPDGSPAA